MPVNGNLPWNGNMQRQFVVVERDEEGHDIASFARLPGCHTQAKSLDDVMTRIREAIELCRATIAD